MVHGSPEARAPSQWCTVPWERRRPRRPQSLYQILLAGLHRGQNPEERVTVVDVDRGDPIGWEIHWSRPASGVTCARLERAIASNPETSLPSGLRQVGSNRPGPVTA